MQVFWGRKDRGGRVRCQGFRTMEQGALVPTAEIREMNAGLPVDSQLRSRRI